MKYFKYIGGNNDAWDEYFTKEYIYPVKECRGSFCEIKCDNGDMKIAPKEVFTEPTIIELINNTLLTLLKWFSAIMTFFSLYAVIFEGKMQHIFTAVLFALLTYLQSKKIK